MDMYYYGMKHDIHAQHRPRTFCGKHPGNHGKWTVYAPFNREGDIVDVLKANGDKTCVKLGKKVHSDGCFAIENGFLTATSSKDDATERQKAEIREICMRMRRHADDPESEGMNLRALAQSIMKELHNGLTVKEADDLIANNRRF